MYSQWIDPPASSQCVLTPEMAALKEAFLAAQKVAFGLSYASNQLSRSSSPDLNDCAAIIRAAVHKPEKEQQTALKAAQVEVFHRQLNYVCAISIFHPHAAAWKALRPSLVAALEAVVLAKQEHQSRYGSLTAPINMDFALNCALVANLIDGCDISINEMHKRNRFNRPTITLAESAFQKVFDALLAEVSSEQWMMNARLGSRARHSKDILKDHPVETVWLAEVPEEFAKCKALDEARSQFEQAFNWDLTSRCRDFNQSTRGSFNETQFSESLLAASSVDSMLHVEERRDQKLRDFGSTWRAIRSKVDNCQELFLKVAELLPQAAAEAAAIEDINLRRRAQILCMYAVRRLKENLPYLREADRNVGDFPKIDVNAAFGRSHQALVERFKTKDIHQPTTRCNQEEWMGE